MRGIALWLLRKVFGSIEGFLDPDLKTRVAALNARVAEAEAKEKEAAELQRQSEAAYAESVKRREELAARLAANRELEAADEQALKESDARRQQIAAELVKTEAAIADRPDTDRLEQPLPGTDRAGR